MHSNSYLSSGFKLRDIFTKLTMAFSVRQRLALVRSIPGIAGMWRQGDDLIVFSLRNLTERVLEKSRIIVSSYREDDGSKKIYIEFAGSLPRHQVMKILKAANQIVISSAAA